MIQLTDNEREVLLKALDGLSTYAVTSTTEMTEDEVEEAIETLMEKAQHG